MWQVTHRMCIVWIPMLPCTRSHGADQLSLFVDKCRISVQSTDASVTHIDAAAHPFTLPGVPDNNYLVFHKSTPGAGMCIWLCPRLLGVQVHCTVLSRQIFIKGISNPNAQIMVYPQMMSHKWVCTNWLHLPLKQVHPDCESVNYETQLWT